MIFNFFEFWPIYFWAVGLVKTFGNSGILSFGKDINHRSYIQSIYAGNAGWGLGRKTLRIVNCHFLKKLFMLLRWLWSQYSPFFNGHFGFEMQKGTQIQGNLEKLFSWVHKKFTELTWLSECKKKLILKYEVKWKIL